MVPVKIVCSCGQKYAFDVEPVNGRMGSPVACPVCGAEGTAAANEFLKRSVPAPTAAAPAPALSMPVRSAAPAAPAAATPPPFPTAPPATQAPGTIRPLPQRDSGAGGLAGLRDANRWQWWYFIVAGLLLGAYDIYKYVDTGLFKWLEELLFPVFCIFIGIWDFQRKRRRARGS